MSFDSSISLNAKVRTERGKNESRRLRAAGFVPVTVYGGGQESASTTVVKREFAALIRAHGRNGIFTLNVDGAETPVKIADMQLDPLRGTMIHADLMRISLTEKSKFDIPLKLTGEPEGVKLGGGILEFVTHLIEVRCLPTELPESIEVDVSHLGLGDHFNVSDLKLNENIEVLSEPDTIIATVSVPREEEVAAVTPEAEAPVEPEVVKKGKPEEKK